MNPMPAGAAGTTPEIVEATRGDLATLGAKLRAWSGGLPAPERAVLGVLLDGSTGPEGYAGPAVVEARTADLAALGTKLRAWSPGLTPSERELLDLLLEGAVPRRTVEVGGEAHGPLTEGYTSPFTRIVIYLDPDQRVHTAPASELEATTTVMEGEVR